MPLLLKIVLGLALLLIAVIGLGLWGFRQLYLANHPEPTESE